MLDLILKRGMYYTFAYIYYVLNKTFYSFENFIFSHFLIVSKKILQKLKKQLMCDVMCWSSKL